MPGCLKPHKAKKRKEEEEGKQRGTERKGGQEEKKKATKAGHLAIQEWSTETFKGLAKPPEQFALAFS